MRISKVKFSSNRFNNPLLYRHLLATVHSHQAYKTPAIRKAAVSQHQVLIRSSTLLHRARPSDDIGRGIAAAATATARPSPYKGGKCPRLTFFWMPLPRCPLLPLVMHLARSAPRPGPVLSRARAGVIIVVVVGRARSAHPPDTVFFWAPSKK